MLACEPRLGEGPEHSGGQLIRYQSAVWPQESQWHPGLGLKQSEHQGQGGNHLPVLSTGGATPQAMGPVLQEGH